MPFFVRHPQPPNRQTPAMICHRHQHQLHTEAHPTGCPQQFAGRRFIPAPHHHSFIVQKPSQPFHHTHFARQTRYPAGDPRQMHAPPVVQPYHQSNHVRQLAVARLTQLWQQSLVQDTIQLGNGDSWRVNSDSGFVWCWVAIGVCCKSTGKMICNRNANI